MDSSTATTRRAILRRTGAVGASSVGAVLLARDAEAARQQVTKRFITPRVDRFEDNYEGQWIQVTEPVDGITEVVDDCEFADWSADETQAYDALLLDRRVGSEVAIETTAFANGTRTDIDESSIFIVNDTNGCDEDFIGLSGESVPQRAIAGKPAGPAVTETNEDGIPGPGALGALAAVSAGAFLRALRKRRE